MRLLTRKNVRLLILTLLGIGCYMMLRYTGKPNAPFFEIGKLRLPNSTKGGVISGSLSLICFLLVFHTLNPPFFLYRFHLLTYYSTFPDKDLQEQSEKIRGLLPGPFICSIRVPGRHQVHHDGALSDRSKMNYGFLQVPSELK